MDDMNQQPFERQVADVANRAVGPERHVEALAIARHAATVGRSRPRPLFGAIRFAMGAAAVVALGVALVMSGVLQIGEDSADVGASPSPTVDTPTEPLDARPEEVLYTGGSFTGDGIDWWNIEGPWSDDPDDTPRSFTVTSTDSRLAGEAILLGVREDWRHVLTTRDLEEFRPTGAIEAAVGRLQIRNADGTWEGILGPSMRASGDWEQPAGDGDTVLRDAPMVDGRATAVLEGRGAYAGMTAYVGFVDDILLAPAQVGRERAFEAVIVNALPPRPPSSQAFDQAREWIEMAREAGAIE